MVEHIQIYICRTGFTIATFEAIIPAIPRTFFAGLFSSPTIPHNEKVMIGAAVQIGISSTTLSHNSVGGAAPERSLVILDDKLRRPGN